MVGSQRGVPDVAWNAAVNGGVLVFHSYFPQIEGNPAWGVFGGTSASSPQVAAVTAIANQARGLIGAAFTFPTGTSVANNLFRGNVNALLSPNAPNAVPAPAGLVLGIIGLGSCGNVGGAVPTSLAGTQSSTHPTAATSPAVLDNPCMRSVGATCTAHALDAFAASVNAQKQTTATTPIRLSFIGDSLTADDQIVDRVRTKLQRALGNGGPGFVFVIPPHPYCQQRAATRSLSGTWTARGVIGAAEADHLMGLGGSSATVLSFVVGVRD